MATPDSTDAHQGTQDLLDTDDALRPRDHLHAESGGAFKSVQPAVNPDGSVRHAFKSVQPAVNPDGSVRHAESGGAFKSVQPESATAMRSVDPRTEPGAQAQGAAEEQRVVDGQHLSGRVTQDGGFLSADGKTYVSPSGEVQHGLTAPDGSFLPNGAVRTVDGQQVYGSVLPDGSFLSQDGTELVLPSGVVEHGRTAPAGTFEYQRTVDGQPVWGSDTGDGWLSSDGKTYIDSSGNADTGITTPDGQFIAGGSTYTLPDGTVLYGHQDGAGFVSADGTTVVLPDGTVLKGTTDTNTGIFTANNGATYALLDSGMAPVTKQDDGSYQTPDGQLIMTAESWRVDLQAFSDSLSLVSAKAHDISGFCDTIKGQYGLIEMSWSSPAGGTFSDAATKANNAMDTTRALLSDVINRMKMSYDNYVQAEHANVQNSTGS